MFDYQDIHDQLYSQFAERTAEVFAKLQKARKLLDDQPNHAALRELLLCSEIISSASIEHVNLTLENLFLENITIGGRDIALYNPQSSNMRVAYGLAAKMNPEDISADTILDLHKIMFKREPEALPGQFRYRDISIGDPRTGWVQYSPPPPDHVPDFIEDLLHYVNQPDRDFADAFMRSIIAHAGFECTHPFRDGNGRTGRLLIPLAMQDEFPDTWVFPLSAYISQNKAAYYECLKQIPRDGVAAWANWLNFALTGMQATAELVPKVIEAVNQELEMDRLQYKGENKALDVINYLANYPVTSLASLEASVQGVNENYCRTLHDKSLIRLKIFPNKEDGNAIVTYRTFMDAFIAIPWYYLSAGPKKNRQIGPRPDGP